MKIMKKMVWCQWVLLSIDSLFSRLNIFIKIIFGEKEESILNKTHWHQTIFFIVFINFLFSILISYLYSDFLFIFLSSFYFLYFFFVSTILVGCEQDIDEKPIKAKRLKPVVDPVPEDPSSGWWTASKK